MRSTLQQQYILFVLHSVVPADVLATLVARASGGMAYYLPQAGIFRL